MKTKEKSKVTTAPQGTKKRVFSGIQPSRDVQLGNYLGAIKGWIERNPADPL